MASFQIYDDAPFSTDVDAPFSIDVVVSPSCGNNSPFAAPFLVSFSFPFGSNDAPFYTDVNAPFSVDVTDVDAPNNSIFAAPFLVSFLFPSATTMLPSPQMSTLPSQWMWLSLPSAAMALPLLLPFWLVSLLLLWLLSSQWMWLSLPSAATMLPLPLPFLLLLALSSVSALSLMTTAHPLLPYFR